MAARECWIYGECWWSGWYSTVKYTSSPVQAVPLYPSGVCGPVRRYFRREITVGFLTQYCVKIIDSLINKAMCLPYDMRHNTDYIASIKSQNLTFITVILHLPVFNNFRLGCCIWLLSLGN